MVQRAVGDSQIACNLCLRFGAGSHQLDRFLLKFSRKGALLLLHDPFPFCGKSTLSSLHPPLLWVKTNLGIPLGCDPSHLAMRTVRHRCMSRRMWLFMRPTRDLWKHDYPREKRDMYEHLTACLDRHVDRDGGPRHRPTRLWPSQSVQRTKVCPLVHLLLRDELPALPADSLPHRASADWPVRR